MWNKLSDFYVSKEWRDMRMQLIVERTHEDGFVYCEYSGKPIYKAWEIIAHHKIPLTMANVNDYSISLNPDNIQLVSHRSHNEIHARFGFMAQKKVYYVYGAPCSGKSTFVGENKGDSDLIVDVDLLWQAITGGGLYEKPDALKAPVFALRDSLLDVVKTRAGKWERAYVIEGGARKGDRERRINALGAEPIFIDADKETCLERLASDDKRVFVREQWHGYIEEWFRAYQP